MNSKLFTKTLSRDADAGLAEGRAGRRVSLGTGPAALGGAAPRVPLSRTHSVRLRDRSSRFTWCRKLLGPTVPLRAHFGQRAAVLSSFERAARSLPRQNTV
ncbi:hypothetical protein AAFF_G00114650 [Aldrovandia affinis]|uniref:Uncharacterized protein n=1 Tax=Aldrovandia affinis TaxID=143900 RepID=A0AAD7WBF0_9TELE|nr:hypothetical protein AAFF_G00114650 [Aldrovandia affinis]